jgi:hypothetical protein
MRSNFPEELMLADAFKSAGLSFLHESDGGTHNLDFKIGDVYVEVKQFHSPRAIEQCGRVDNVILVQGRKAAEFLAALIKQIQRPSAE